MAAVRSLGAVRNGRRLAFFACGRRRGRFLSGGGRPSAALFWHSYRRLGRAAALAAAWRLVATLPWRRLALSARCVVLVGSGSVRVVVGTVASSLGAVAVARRSQSRCLRRRAGAPSAGTVVLPRSRRRVARRRSSAVAARSRSLGAVRNARRLALFACGCWCGRFLAGGGRRRAARTTPLPAALRWRSWHQLCRAAVLAATWHSAAALSWPRLVLSARYVMLSGSRSLRVVVGAVASSLGAVAVARRARHCCLRRRAGAPGAGSVVPPRSRQRGARPPLFRGGGPHSRRGVQCSTARALCVWTSTRSLPLWGRSPSRGAHGAAACGAAMALLAPAGSCHRARGGVAHGRRSSAEAASSLSEMHLDRRLALSAVGRRRGRFLSG